MSFRSLPAGLLSNIVSSYDQTKSTTGGQAVSRTVLGQQVISPPPIKWLDIFTDSGEIPLEIDFTPNGRVFALTAITAGLARLIMYNFNALTGVFNYVGKVQLTFPNTAATTHTLRGMKVDDSNTANIQAIIATTGTVAINGGAFRVNLLVLADFVPAGFATLPAGSGSNQKAVYFMQDPANIGQGQLNIASAGVLLDRTAKVAYVHNGVSAAHQYYLYDYSQVPNTPQQNCTTPVASPGVVNATAHGYVANDPVTFYTTGALPTGLTVGTTYFVIATGLTANAFEVALTVGGAAINFTGSTSGQSSVSRANGISSAAFKWKTGNLPALAGVLLINNSEVSATPLHTTNSGSLCAAFATSTALYLGKLSDLTSGQTMWPSLVTSNLLGSASQIVAPLAVTCDYDDTFDRFVFSTSVTKFIAKQCVNSVIQSIYGELNNDYLEGASQTDLYTQFGATTIGDVRVKNGWHLICGTAIGQRGVLAMNHGADTRGDATYIITPVMTLPPQSALNAVTLSRQNRVITNEPAVFYRTSGFGTATGGWIALSTDLIFPANTTVGVSGQIQFKLEWSMTDLLSSQPYFPSELYIRHLPPTQLSDNWEGSVDNSTSSGASPMYVAFRQTTVYGTLPSKLVVRGVDDSGNTIFTFDTSVSLTPFSQSSNNGTSWAALASVASLNNVAGTSEVRVLVASPSGTRLTWSIGES